MIKLLIGGSPCTHWSIAQTKNRETKAEGIGWELFRNYLIAKDKFKSDFFLYENNKSADIEIKRQIAESLGVNPLAEFTGEKERFTYINSALVSAQSRERFYVTNFGDIEQPKEKGITLYDVLEHIPHIKKELVEGKQSETTELVGIYPIRGTDKIIACQGQRIYDIRGKTVTISSSGGGMGGSGGGLYATPLEDVVDDDDVFVVEEGIATSKKTVPFPVNLPNGKYYIRKLTPLECERLQTLPDNYTKVEGVSKTWRYHGIGNGWTAEVIIHLLNHALKGIPKNEEIIVLSMYDGIGTGRYCLDKMGFTNIKYYAYEIEKTAIQIAKANYPDIIHLGDAFDVRKEDWNLAEK